MNKEHRDLLASISRAVKSNTALLEAIAKMGNTVTLTLDPVVHVSTGEATATIAPPPTSTPRKPKGSRTPTRPSKKNVRVSFSASPSQVAQRLKAKENYITRARYAQIRILGQQGKKPAQIVQILRHLGYVHINQARVKRALASDVYRYNL